MLIGITGSSGSGKSTVSNYIEEKLNNAKLITVDDIMKSNVRVKYRKEIQEAFNQDELDPIALFQNIDTVNKWLDICKDNMDLEIEELVDEYSKTYDYVLADYVFLPMLGVWDKCDLTINVKADKNIQFNRLKQRLIDSHHTQNWTGDDTIRKRIECSVLDEYGYKAQHTVYNNGTLDELLNQVDNILIEIKEN